MDKDQVKGEVKDIAGRVQRQAGEWTGDHEQQVRGARKQLGGKLQKQWGKLKDASRQAAQEREEEKEKAEAEKRARRHDADDETAEVETPEATRKRAS